MTKMPKESCCPDCESPEGNSCPTCCSHYNTKVMNTTSGYRGRYLQEIAQCQDCGYFEVLNEIDYYTEFPPL